MWRTCARCGGQQWQCMVEVTELGDRVPRYLPGQPEPCGWCGNTEAPILVEPAPSMALVPYGPAIPTPDDMLRAAGLLA